MDGSITRVVIIVRDVTEILLLERHWVHGWAIFDCGERCSVSGHLEELLVVLSHLGDAVGVAQLWRRVVARLVAFGNRSYRVRNRSSQI